MKNAPSSFQTNFVFEKNSNFPNVYDDLLPTLENNTTSQIIAKNLIARHQARQNYIKHESSSKIKQAFKYQVWTYSDLIYNTGDRGYY